MRGLGQSSLSDDERKTEALRLLGELEACTELMPPKSRRFVEDLNDRKDSLYFSVTPKQLFWLRDLYQSYILGE